MYMHEAVLSTFQCTRGDLHADRCSVMTQPILHVYKTDITPHPHNSRVTLCMIDVVANETFSSCLGGYLRGFRIFYSKLVSIIFTNSIQHTSRM